MIRKISQRTARAAIKRVAQLECDNAARIKQWARDYPGGVNIVNIPVDDVSNAKIETAKSLGYSLVATQWNRNQISIYAVKP